MKEEKREGKERDAPMHYIKTSKLSHAGCVTKNKTRCSRGYAVSDRGHTRALLLGRDPVRTIHRPYQEDSDKRRETRSS